MAAHCPLIAFLCLAVALLTAEAAEGNDQECPEGWTSFGTRCFKFFQSTSTWIKAEESCQSHGANLASIHSAEENAFVVDLIKEATRGYQVTWIGGHDAVQENRWMWTDGSVWDYSNWHAGQPDNHSRKEHFVVINWGATLWNDYIDDLSLPYICAKDEPEDKSVSLILGNSLCNGHYFILKYFLTYGVTSCERIRGSG